MSIFKRGSVVSPATLGSLFSGIVHRLNNLGPADILRISTGQLFIDSKVTGVATEHIQSEILSSSCEQFLDSEQPPVYALYEEAGVVNHAPSGYLASVKDRIGKLEART